MTSTNVSTTKAEEKVYWHPLESNPEAMNQLIHTLGVSELWAYSDILGLDDELLAMVPQPCLAVIMLFPMTDAYMAFAQEQEERIAREGQHVSPKIYYMRQTIRNACGTYAVLHSLANNQHRIEIANGPLKQFFDETAGLTPNERSEHLKKAREIAQAHVASAHIGQTETPQADASVDLHFVCFVECDGNLYELDGGKQRPINHGPCQDLLKDTAKVVREYMAREPDLLQFNLIALAPNVAF